MKEDPDIARIGSLIGDPARANMLTALMSGKALTVTELAFEASVSLQTASSHLKQLIEGGLVKARKCGRHRYVELASEEVAAVLGGVMGLAEGAGLLRTRTGPRDAALRKARSCYNHLAGEMGTRLFRSLVQQGYLAHNGDDMELTGEGKAFVESFGIDGQALRRSGGPLCKECLDWSERKSHLAGRLGRAFLQRFGDLGWAQRDPESRAVLFTQKGEAAFHARFPVEPPRRATRRNLQPARGCTEACKMTQS